MKNFILFLFGFLAVGQMACVSGHCREHREEAMKKSSTDGVSAEVAKGSASVGAGSGSVAPTTSLPVRPMDRVRVFKYDGSLQCNMGKPIPPSEMQKELGKITVYSSENKNDGLMRMQMCGAATGRANVFEIDRKDLEAAKKLGFKEWTYE